MNKKKLSEIAGMLKSDLDLDITAAGEVVDDYFEKIQLHTGLKS